MTVGSRLEMTPRRAQLPKPNRRRALEKEENMNCAVLYESLTKGIGFGVPISLFLILVGHVLKKDLEKGLIVFSQLHKTRAKIIGKLYRRISKLERANNGAFQSGVQFGGDRSKAEQKAYKQYKKFLPYAQDNKFWFNNEIDKLIDEICIKMNRLWSNYNQAKAWAEQMTPEVRGEISNEVKLIIEDDDGLKDKLTYEFRKLLGIKR